MIRLGHIAWNNEVGQLEVKLPLNAVSNAQNKQKDG